ncbi:MAG: aspartate/glutamate racemase family protein [Prosthecobacter sp.]
MKPAITRLVVLALTAAAPWSAADTLLSGWQAHLENDPHGERAFTFDASSYSRGADLSDLPIGVFDSGIGGLTVLEALLTADVFHNDDLKPGADGKPDFEDERFIYLGDQANMPYGNYSSAGKVDFLRELILKDAVFLLGKRYWSAVDAVPPRHDKPPVKAIVIACNTATAYGLADIREAVKAWGIPVIVVGVVEAGARGLLTTANDGAVGVLATVGTCASEVYPKTIQSTLGLAGRPAAAVTQFGSASLAGVIEGDPAHPKPLAEQIALDVHDLVEAHRKACGSDVVPIKKVMLGCTHFPLVVKEIDAAFEDLRQKPEFAPWIAGTREFINPAEWTARELFGELAKARIRRKAGAADAKNLFFISVANPRCLSAKLAEAGVLDHAYKYGREPGHLEIEDTLVVPMTRSGLPEVSRRLVEAKLPTVWARLPR